jgi:hypothetical protein
METDLLIFEEVDYANIMTKIPYFLLFHVYQVYIVELKNKLNNYFPIIFSSVLAI